MEGDHKHKHEHKSAIFFKRESNLNRSGIDN